MDQIVAMMVERFGILGVTLAALGFIGRWLIQSYQDKEDRLMRLLDERENEIRRLVDTAEKREETYRNEIKDLSDKFIASLERISGTINAFGAKIEEMSTEIRALKRSSKYKEV